MEAKTDRDLIKLSESQYDVGWARIAFRIGFRQAESPLLARIAEQDTRIAELEKEVERLAEQSSGWQTEYTRLVGINDREHAKVLQLESELETLRKEKV